MNPNNQSIPKNLPLLLLSMVLIVSLGVSCNSTGSGNEEDNVQFEDGISLDIKELLGDELLTIIENDLEMPIHRGDNPPEIETLLSQQTKTVTSTTTGAAVLMQPLLLHRTNVPTDQGVRGPGFQFADLYLRFQNQDMVNYTIDVDDVQIGIEKSSSKGAFIIGNENRFSIFGPAIEVIGSDTVLTVEIFSGTITNQGITSPYHTLVMVNNSGVTRKIPNNTGRSFFDGDSVASLVIWPEDQQKRSSDLPGITDERN